MNTKILGYKINITEAGRENLTGLIQDVNKLTNAANGAAPQYDALAKEVRKLGEQQAAIDGMARLKTEMTELSDRQQELQERTKSAAKAIKEKEAALKAATEAEKQSAAALAEGKSRQEELKTAITESKTELQDLKKQADAAGGASETLAANIADTEKQLQVLQQEARSAADGVKLLSAAHKEDEAATKTANAESKQAQKEFGLVRDQATTATDAVRQKAEALEEMRDKLREAGLSSKSLASDQVELKTKIADMAAEVEKAQQVLSDREALGIKAHAEIQQEIDETRAAYERLKASGTLTNTELAQAALKTEERVRELQHQTNGWTDSIAKARTAFAGLIASGAGIAVVANQAIQFESAMADVAKVVDGTDEQIASLSKRIREMTAEIPLAAAELAQIAAAGGQLGVPIEKLDQFIKLAATMATAFNMSAEEAGQAVAKLSNIFGLQLEGVEQLGDAINTLGNTTAANERDIIEVLTRIGGTAKQFGLTAEQAAALGTAMLSLGVSSEVAGTGINAILTKLQTANIQGADFQKALASMGISARKLAEDIRANPQQALTEFLRTLETLDNASKSEILSRLFGVEYQDDVSRLLAGLDGYEDALRKVADAGATAGAMQKEFETRVNTTEEQIKLLINGLQTAAINLGSILLPAITPVVTALGDMTHAVAAFIDEYPAIAGIAGAVVTVATSVGALRLAWLAMSVASQTALTDMRKLLPLLKADIGSVIAESGKLGGALKTAAAVGTAAFAGWQLGTYLREEFLIVELAGIKLAKTLTQAAALVQTAWEVTKAVFTDDTIDAALKRGEERLAEINSIYNDIARDAIAAKEAQKTAAKEAGEAVAEQTEKFKALNKQLNETGDPAKGEALRRLASEFDALGLDASQAMGTVSTESQKVIDSVDSIARSLQEAQAPAKQASAAIESAMTAAIGKADNIAALDAMQAQLVQMAQSGQISDAAMQRLTQTMQAQRTQLQSLTPEMKALEEARKREAEAATLETEAKVQSLKASQQILSSEADLLRQKAEMARQRGLNTAATDLERQAAEKELEIKRLGLEIAAAELETGRKLLEINTQKLALDEKVKLAEYQQALAAEKKNWALIEQIGNELELIELQKEKMAAEGQALDAQQKGIASGRELINLQEEQRKRSLLLAAAYSEAGAAGENAGRQIANGMSEASKATQKAADDARFYANTAWDAGKDLVAQARAHNNQIGQTQTTWLSASAAVSEYANEAAQAAYSENKWYSEKARIFTNFDQIWQTQYNHMRMMGESADHYIQRMQGLDALQKSIESSNKGAASGVADLKLKLLEIEGTEQEIAAARHERSKAEIVSQQALIRIEMQRAELRKDNAEAARLRQEIDLLAEQLKLLDQIQVAEQRKAAQAKADAAQAAKQQASTSSTSKSNSTSTLRIEWPGGSGTVEGLNSSQQNQLSGILRQLGAAKAVAA